MGELSPAAQAALLRVIETKRFSRVGSSREIAVDVRILAATNRDLGALSNAGRFRPDLLYRLNTMTLELPPLRDRIDDIEPLARHFVILANWTNDCAVERIAPEAMDLLLRYPWSGNVRELRNAIERAVVISAGTEITAEDLPEPIRAGERPRSRSSDDQSPPPVTYASPADPAPAIGSVPVQVSEPEINLRDTVERFEAELILEVLRKSNWDRRRAARKLNLPLSTLAHKMRSNGISRSSKPR